MEKLKRSFSSFRFQFKNGKNFSPVQNSGNIIFLLKHLHCHTGRMHKITKTLQWKIRFEKHTFTPCISTRIETHLLGSSIPWAVRGKEEELQEERDGGSLLSEWVAVSQLRVSAVSDTATHLTVTKQRWVLDSEEQYWHWRTRYGGKNFFSYIHPTSPITTNKIIAHALVGIKYKEVYTDFDWPEGVDSFLQQIWPLYTNLHGKLQVYVKYASRWFQHVLHIDAQQVRPLSSLSAA